MESLNIQNDSSCRLTYSDRVSREEVLQVTQFIESLREQLPSDCIINCQIDRHENTYCATVEATALKNKFSSIDSGQELLTVFLRLHETLFRQIREWRNSRFSSAFRKKRRVLIVDDAPDSVALIESVFQKNGWDVECATDSRFGIEKILCKPFDLLVVDFQMPGLNGAQTLNEIENRIQHNPTVIEHWQKEELPFVTYSGKNFEISPSKLSHLICIENWDKNFEFKELERRIRAIDSMVKSVA